MKLQAAKKKKTKTKKSEYLEAMGNPVAGKILGNDGMKGKMSLSNGRSSNKD